VLVLVLVIIMSVFVSVFVSVTACLAQVPTKAGVRDHEQYGDKHLRKYNPQTGFDTSMKIDCNYRTQPNIREENNGYDSCF